MTRFIDINEQQPAPDLPSVAMNFNGYFIEDKLDGYRTLNVTGRETISYDIHTLGNSSSIHGEVITGKTLPARELKIEYQLTAETNEKFQQKARTLVQLLHTDDKDATIYFNDDQSIAYYGQLSKMDEIPPDSNNVTSTFTIYCQDPMKYSRNVIETEDADMVTLDNYGVLSPYAITPDMIKLNATTDIDLAGVALTVTNTNTSKSITIDFGANAGSITSGQYIGIDIKNNQIYRRFKSDNGIVDGVNFIKYLRFETTDFHDFKVKPNDTIETTTTGFTVSLVLRGEWR